MMDDTWESCKECEGDGTVFIMLHENYDEVEFECKACEGTGKHRFSEDTYGHEYSPY